MAVLTLDGRGGWCATEISDLLHRFPSPLSTAQVSSKFLLDMETDTGTVRLVILNRSVLHTLKKSHALEADQQNLLV